MQQLYTVTMDNNVIVNNNSTQAIPVLLTFSVEVSFLDISSFVHKHTVDDAPLLVHASAPQSWL